MGRARRSGFSAILVLLALAGLTIAMPLRSGEVATAAAVGWPPSSLVVSEIATGGASASDEFVELFNAGGGATDLLGLELVYVTASGSTVTQKAGWTVPRSLAPGQHLLIANSAGAYATLGDATYTGGFAATGGAVALRIVGGATIDAIGWGDATNAFVEGSAAGAPPAGSSLERRPGGVAGNGTDTNENAADWFVQGTPGPQNLTSPVSPLPTPTPVVTPTIVPQPSASPSVPASLPVCDPVASPTVTPGPSASQTPSASPTPTPTPTPAPTTASIPIVDVRAQPIGASVRVRGVVTAEAGRLGTAALLAIADESAGIVVRLATGAIGPERGTTIEVEGRLAAPYGQLEIRPPIDGILAEGAGTLPDPLPIMSSQLGEAVEGGLVAVDVLIDKAPHRESNGSVTLDAADATTGGRLAIRADASSGIATSDLPRHARAHLVGIVGQRATRSGRLDGYRIWLRDRADIVLTETPGASPTPSGSPSPTGASAAPTVPIGQALLSPGDRVRVVGTVTAAGRLLDGSGRVVVIQDATAAVAVRLSTGTATPRVGARLRVDGTVGRAYGAPRIAANEAVVVGTGSTVLPLALHTAPGAAHEWRLVRVEGEVVDVHKLGDRWRAEIAVGSNRLLVSGLPDSGLAVTALVEGRRATVIGIVRRPYPTATDRRFAIVPRSTGDVRLGAAAGPGANDPATGSGPGSNGGPGGNGSPGAVSGPGGPLDVDIAALAEHQGELVRVGGLVTAVEPEAILLDDGTATGRIVLKGDAAALLGLLAPGEALDAVGRVRGTPAGAEIEVTSAADIVRVGDPGSDPNGGPSAGPDGSPAGQLNAGEGQTAPLPGPTGPATAVLLVLGGAVLAALAACVVAVRRRRERQATSGRVALRLAALTGGRSDELAPAGPSPDGGA